MNMTAFLVLAAALSVGNAEFEQTAANGAASIAVTRIRAELAEKGIKSGLLEDAMLADSEKFKSSEAAKRLCRDLYADAARRAFAEQAESVKARLGLGDEFRPSWDEADAEKVLAGFDAAFAAERKSACEKQAKTIAGAVKPTETEFETKGVEALRAEMTAKVIAQQRTAVFEENVRYVSETIVDPVLEDAAREQKRQREYLMRTKCESFAPSALARELEENLRRNVADRAAKEKDPVKTWGVFPKTLTENVPSAVERRTADRVAKNVDDVPVVVEQDAILKTIRDDPSAHRQAEASEGIFRGIFAAEVLSGARQKALAEAPEKERQELEEYLQQHPTSPEIIRAIDARVRREVLPKWRAARAEAAKTEAERIWPTLADGTWYPDADLADEMAARSDYAAAVKDWRKASALAELAQADGGQVLMEETVRRADGSVAAAFDLARNAIAAQNAIIAEVEPSVLGEAKDRKSSFWRATPDLPTIIGLLTEAVEAKWGEQRVTTLWGDGTRPANADAQHAELFPSVKKRIELVARSILEEMEKPEPEPEEKPEPEEPPPEDPSQSDSQSEEEPLLLYSIVVQREGGSVTVKLEQGKSTVAERSAPAKMSDYQDAMKFVSDKLGKDILGLK